MTHKTHPLDGLAFLRSLILTPVAGLWTMVMSVVMLIALILIRHRPTIDFLIDKVWAWPIIKLSNVQVEVRGAEHVREDGPGALLLFNHSSLFDILVLYCYYPRTFRFGAKIELFKIPVFGTAMRLAGVLPIDRRNRTEVMKVYAAAIDRVQAGESFALAPEGTRQGEAQLGAFKRGPFEFAINARAEVQPVVIAGAFEVLPKDGVLINRSRWHRRVILEIGPALPTRGMTAEDAPALQTETRARMQATFDRAYADLASN